MAQKKISVITPSFNSREVIERAVQSVLVQDYTCWEHVIVDGGSTDGTIDLLKKYPHLKWISEKDRGQADAMNKGFSLSTGDIIVYLNADDYFLPGAFSAVMAVFEKGASFVVGNVLVMSPRLGTEFINTPRTTLDGMLRHWEPNAFCYNPVGYFYTREVQEHCPFNVHNYATMDLEFLLDAAAVFPFTKVNRTLGCFEDSLSNKTHETQVKPDYWNPATFPYIEKHLSRMLQADREQYLSDRRAGYKQYQAEANFRARREGCFAPEVPDQGAGRVSVIIPTWNTADFLCRAVDSVLAQTMQNFEIIIVNDASTDESLALLKRYEADPRVRVITHAINKGLGAARNTGIEYAQGEFLFFLDSDDWIESTTLQLLMGIALHYDADIVAGGVDKVYPDGTCSAYHAFDFSCSGGKDALAYLSDYSIGSIAWNKIYRRNFITANNLRFTEGYLHEDVMFSMRAVYACRKYISISDICYHYFQRPRSIINSGITKKKIASYIKFWQEFSNFSNQYNLLEKSETHDLALNLLKAHGSSDFSSHIIEYLKEDFDESRCEELCTIFVQFFGENGYIISDALIPVIKNIISNK